MSAILHMQLISFNVLDKYTIPFQGDNSMNSKLYMFAGVTALLMLTGCYKDKDKVCKEYHKTRAKGSAFIAKEAAVDSVRHGFEAARAGSKEVYEAANAVAGKAQQLSSKAMQKIKHVAHKTHASCAECNEHRSPSSDKSTTRVVYEKEIHIEEETE